jgi:hypothetical protein
VRRLALVVAVLALALPAGAAAATLHFTGGTEQGLKLSFDYVSHKVKSFRVKVRCTGSRIQTFTFPTMRVNSRGRFSLHQAGPSLDGRIRGDRASGTLTLRGCSANANEVEFIAKHQ